MYSDRSSLKPCMRQIGGSMRFGHHFGALDTGSDLRNRFGFFLLNPAQHLVSEMPPPTL